MNAFPSESENAAREFAELDARERAELAEISIEFPECKHCGFSLVRGDCCTECEEMEFIGAATEPPNSTEQAEDNLIF